MVPVKDLPLFDLVDNLKGEIIGTLKEMIEIPTVNPPGLNYPDFIKYITHLLDSWGIDHKVIEGPAGNEDRASVIGYISGWEKKSLHFHGHYDVVPAQNVKQFKPFIKDGKLYGRGSSDMKGGIVSMLYAIKILKDRAKELKGSLSFSIVPDEETGGAGGIHNLFKTGKLPLDGCVGMIMPEPSSGVIWNASRGALTIRVNFKGKHAHVALADGGINAFEHMVKTVGPLMKLKDDITSRITALPAVPESARKSAIVIGGECGSGVNFNTVPEKAWFTIDRRFNPEEKLEEVKKEIIDLLEEQKKQGIDLSYEILQEEESSISTLDSPLAEALSDSFFEAIGTKPRFELCPGLLECRFFSKLGIPSYGYGPGLLEISHGSEEYIDIDTLIKSTSIYLQTIMKYFEKG